MRAGTAIMLLASCIAIVFLGEYCRNQYIPWVQTRSSRAEFVEDFIRAIEEQDIEKIMSCHNKNAEVTIFLMEDHPGADNWNYRGDAYIYEEQDTLTREETEEFYKTLGERYQRVELKKPGYNSDHQGISYIWYKYPNDRSKGLLFFEFKPNLTTSNGEKIWKITNCSIKEREQYAYTPTATRS